MLTKLYILPSNLIAVVLVFIKIYNHAKSKLQFEMLMLNQGILYLQWEIIEREEKLNNFGTQILIDFIF